MHPKWIKKFLIFIVLSVLMVGCAKESSESDPNLIENPIQEGAGPDTDFSININQSIEQSDPTIDEEIDFRVVFTRAIDPSTFTVSDITNIGTAAGVVFSISSSGNNKVFKIFTTSIATAGTVQPSILAGQVQNEAQTETNTASTSTDNTVTYNPKFDMTIEQEGSQNDPASIFPMNFDVVFTEAITLGSFTAADIAQGGSATGVTWDIIHNSGNTNFTIQATAASTEGTIIPTVADGIIDNLGPTKTNTASTSTDNSVNYRLNFYVTIDQGISQADPTASLPIDFDVVFDQEIDPATFTNADIVEAPGTATGVSWSIINSGDDTNFTLRATSVTGEGTLIPTIAVDTINDKDGAANNLASTSSDNTVTYASTFDVTIEQGGSQVDPASVTPVEFAVVFSRDIDPLTFTTDDIQESGTATGVTWNIINSGDNINFTLQATAIVGDGTIVPSLLADKVQDPTGGNNTISTSLDNSVTYGSTFTVAIEQGGSQVDPAGTLNVQFDVVFAEAINPATFDGSDIFQNGTAPGVTWNVVHVSANTNFTVQATIIGGEGTLIPSVKPTSVKNAGNTKDNLGSTSNDNSVTWMTDFTVTVNQGSSQPDPTNVFDIDFDVVFEVPIDGASFVVGDIKETGTAGDVAWTIIHVSGNTNYILRATSSTGNGTIIPSIDVGDVDAQIGATNIASTSTDNSVTLSNPTFDVTINQGATQTEDPTATVPIEFDVVFTTAINNSTFTEGDITQDGTATVDTWSVTHVSGNTNYTVRATAISAQGTVIPSIAGNIIQTAGGAQNTISTSTDNTVEYVTSVGVTINQAGGQADPTGSLPITFTAVFDRAINNGTFIPADISNTGTATVDNWTITDSGDQITYTIEATSITGSGTVIPSLDAGKITEVLGTNPNEASTSTDNTVNYFGPPAQIVFGNQPADTPATNTMASFTVEIQDNAGNKVSNATDNVTIAFSNDPTSGSATLSGTLTKAAVNGVATFDNISINEGDTGFTFLASSGALTTDISSTFNITLPAVKLGFLVNPTDSYPLAIIAPAVKVEIRDVNDNLVNTGTDSITLSFQADPSSGAATLGGTLTVSAVSGVATFANLTVDQSYADFTLKATATGLTQAASTVFDILPEAPTNITLIDPLSSPDSDSTPIVRVHGVTNGDTVKVYDGAGCTSPVASYVATGTTVDATTIALSEAVHQLYATRTVQGSTSACSTVFLTYEVQGSFSQLDNMDTAGNWSNVGGDDRDWTFGQSGGTQSTGVGPTSGKVGSYAYTEASNPVNTSDEFWLESNTLDGSSNPLAFTFNFNKRGDNMGDLIVEASNNGGSSWTQVWSHVGADIATSNTDIWRNQFIDLCTLGYTTNNVKIRFKAVMPGSGDVWNSDIAIDELLIDSGGCVSSPPAVVDITVPAIGTEISILNQSAFTVGGSCSDNGQNVSLSGDVSGTVVCSGGNWSIILDLSSHPDGTITVVADHSDSAGGANGSSTRDFIKDANTLQFDNMETLANWSNVSGDDGDWTLLAGETPSDGVGPDDDQSGNQKYVYTEASNPISASDVFILESNDLAAGTYNIKLDFYWNKRGDNMGDIYLEASTDGGNSWDTAIWSHIGQDIPRFGTDVWNNQVIDACLAGYNSGNVRFRFRAVMPSSGSVWHSDIALDSIKLTVDGCQ
jgi:hypothetical protein